MPTNCQFILPNTDFDHIDETLISETLQCAFPHYNNGEGCPTCPVYRQLMETKNPILEHDEGVQEAIQKWWT